MPTRRQFLTAAAASAAAAAAAATLEACGSVVGPSSTIEGPPQVTVPLMSVGQTVAVSGVGEGGEGIAVTRVSDTAVAAVSMQCTHQACSLQLPSASSGGNLACPCHGSLFTVQGAVVRGPAVAPLRSFAATIDTADGQVVVANA